MDQIILCNVKGVARSDKPIEDYHLAAVPLSSTRSFSAFKLTVLFFYGPKLYCFRFGLTVSTPFPAPCTCFH